MRKRALVLALTVLLVVSVVLVGCAGEGVGVGTLQFDANGEDFVRKGFVSKDGWSINFDYVYVTLADVTAYQTDPPYDPHCACPIISEVKGGLDNVYTIDLAEGGEDADPILVGQVEDADVGHYNAISWEMVKATSGPAAGYSLVIIGTAQKDGRVMDFSINIDEECGYSCGEYVGDERKGIVADGGTADLEMTFHFDHIFGDAETPLDDELNLGAIGFEPFAGTAEGGQVDINMAELHLGHVGEGHCHCLCE
jgi:hypothetical protein